MKKSYFLIFFSLLAMVIYTAFSMQNRIIIPVRFTFDKPISCFLPVLVLCSFMAGILFYALCAVFYPKDAAKTKERPIVVPETEHRKKIYSFHSAGAAVIPEEKSRNIPAPAVETAPVPALVGEPSVQLDFKADSSSGNAGVQFPHPGAGVKTMAEPETKDVIECIKCKKEISDLLKLLSRTGLTESAQQ